MSSTSVSSCSSPIAFHNENNSTARSFTNINHQNRASPVQTEQEKADDVYNNHNNKTFSASSVSDQQHLTCYKRNTLPAASSYSSSSVRVSSPLRNSWLHNNNNNTWNDGENSSSSRNSKHQWSTTSAFGGSATIIRRSGKKKNKTSKAERLLTMRRKRRTFPPSADSLRQVEQTNRFKHYSSSTTITSCSVTKKSFGIKINKKQHQRHSLQDILAAFYSNRDEEKISSSSSPSCSNSTTNSYGQKLCKALKRKGKQPVNSGQQKELDSKKETVDRVLPFGIQPIFRGNASLATPSSSSSTNNTISGTSFASTAPSTPLKFPTPPKRSPLAFFFNHHFHKGPSAADGPNSVGGGEQVPRRKSSVVADIIHHVQQRWSNNQPPLRHQQHDVPTDHTSISSLSLSFIPATTVLTDNIDEKQQRPLRRKSYKKEVRLHAFLFVFGFVFFPTWWLGFGYYLYQRGRFTNDTFDINEDGNCTVLGDLRFDENMTSIRTFAYLNGIFSCLSLVLLAVIMCMVIWLIKIS